MVTSLTNLLIAFGLSLVIATLVRLGRILASDREFYFLKVRTLVVIFLLFLSVVVLLTFLLLLQIPTIALSSTAECLLESHLLENITYGLTWAAVVSAIYDGIKALIRR